MVQLLASNFYDISNEYPESFHFVTTATYANFIELDLIQATIADYVNNHYPMSTIARTLVYHDCNRMVFKVALLQRQVRITSEGES